MTHKQTREESGNFGRRTWDIEYYRKKSEDSKKREREEFQEKSRKRKAIAINQALQSRTESITSNIAFGKRKLTLDVSTDDSISNEKITNQKTLNQKAINRSPFYCEICNREYKDNHSFVEHLNSEQHVHASGMMMRAKKSSLDDVLKKLQQTNKSASGTKAHDIQTQKSILSHVDQSLKSQLLQKEDRIQQKQLELQKKEEERLERIKRKESINNVSYTRNKQEKQLQKLLGFQTFGR